MLVSRYPRATFKRIDRYAPGGSSGGAMPNPRRLVLHTAVSSADSLFSLFNTAGNPVAHFYIDEHGLVEQYVDTNRRASAVLDGNADCITVETWDGAGVRPWTPAQVTALAQLCVWVHNEHGIPLTQLPSSRAGTVGVGVHRQGIDGNFADTQPSSMFGGRVIGGEKWSQSFGKMCPLDVRIRQTIEQVLPRARQILSDQGKPAAAAPIVKGANVKHALRRLSAAIRDMKPGARRDKLIRARRLLRRVIRPNREK